MSVFSPTIRRIATRIAKEDWLDFVLARIDPLLAVNRVLARVESVIDETPDIKRFVLAPNGNWKGFTAGQYVTVRAMIDGAFHERCYSLVSAQGNARIEIGVKRQPHGKVSNWLHDHLMPGDLIELGDASGEFVLPNELPEQLLLIAGGSGITPIYSLLAEALTQRADQDVAVMYYVNTAQDLAFARDMQTLADQHPTLRLHFALATDGDAGRFSRAQLEAAIPDAAQRMTYVCGPQGLMNAVSTAWDEQGLQANLKQELFGPPASTGEVTDNAMPIALRRSQQVITNTRANLLESIEASGARPAYGCRIGICKTCSCTKVSGVVRDRITGAIDDAPNSQIRICVSEPLSAVTLDI